MIEVPGIEGERLLRRISFLRSRANAHLEVEQENRHSRACAATLLRDAACIELLMGRTRQACEDLLLAGKELLEVDLVEGAALVALADSVRPQEILGRYSNLIERVRYQEVRVSASDIQDDDRPMFNVSQRSPYQMLALLQSDLLLVKNKVQEQSSVAPSMRMVLEHSGSYPVGATGISVDVYVAIAGGLVGEEELNLSSSSELLTRSLRTLYSVRAENIRVAMKDTYNWQMLLRPTELLDLDSLILMYLAIGDEHLEGELAELLQEESRLCRAPLIIAYELNKYQRSAT